MVSRHFRGGGSGDGGLLQRWLQKFGVGYVIFVAAVAALTIGTMRYFPIVPEYNVCNDSVAWKSLMASMAVMSVEADFEILMSVANYNAIPVRLVKGGGTFYHQGSLVGTFDIPNVTVQAMAVTDVLITAHFSPERWEALSIGKEYYEGRLILSVDTMATIQVPALFEYKFTGQMRNLTVHVNEQSDRSFCNCPTWEQVKNDSDTSHYYNYNYMYQQYNDYNHHMYLELPENEGP